LHLCAESAVGEWVSRNEAGRAAELSDDGRIGYTDKVSTFEQRLLPFRVYLVAAALGVVATVLCFTGAGFDHPERARVVGFILIPTTLAMLGLAVASKRLRGPSTGNAATPSNGGEATGALVVVAGGVISLLIGLLVAVALGGITDSEVPTWYCPSLALGGYVVTTLLRHRRRR
jgi:hypothetical protein